MAQFADRTYDIQEKRVAPQPARPTSSAMSRRLGIAGAWYDDQYTLRRTTPAPPRRDNNRTNNRTLDDRDTAWTDAACPVYTASADDGACFHGAQGEEPRRSPIIR